LSSISNVLARLALAGSGVIFSGMKKDSRFWRENRFLLFQINEIDLFWDDGLGQPTRGVARNT